MLVEVAAALENDVAGGAAAADRCGLIGGTVDGKTGQRVSGDRSDAAVADDFAAAAAACVHRKQAGAIKIGDRAVV